MIFYPIGGKYLTRVSRSAPQTWNIAKSLEHRRRARENGLCQPGVLFCRKRWRSRAARTLSHDDSSFSRDDDTESGHVPHKPRMCSSVTGYMAVFGSSSLRSSGSIFVL